MTGNDWPHYADLPYEVVIETVDEKGNVTHRELCQRNSLLSEAMIGVSKYQRSIVTPKTGRCVLDRPFASHKEPT